MQIINIPITALIPYENNPRINDGAVDCVINSIKRFGFRTPIIVDKEYVIVAGHTRLKAAAVLGLQEIPCIVADDLTSEQIAAYRLVDNQAASLSTWDYEKLERELANIQSIDMSEFSFRDVSVEIIAVDDDYEMELPSKPKAERGQLYKLGRHYLMCGDSTVEDDIDHLMGGATADMLVTDPPYNVNYTGRTEDALSMNNDDLASEEYKTFINSAFGIASAKLKPGAAFYIWYADSEAATVRAACEAAGLGIHQTLIWVKSHFVQSWNDYHWKHEPCLYGWRGGAPHLWASDRKQTTVLNFEKPNKNAQHPTMKPVPLIAYQIQNNTTGGQIVLDIFGGSGTTLIACEQTGRACYMCDNDPKYIDVIIDRWETHTGQKAALVTK